MALLAYLGEVFVKKTGSCSSGNSEKLWRGLTTSCSPVLKFKTINNCQSLDFIPPSLLSDIHIVRLCYLNWICSFRSKIFIEMRLIFHQPRTTEHENLSKCFFFFFALILANGYPRHSARRRHVGQYYCQWQILKKRGWHFLVALHGILLFLPRLTLEASECCGSTGTKSSEISLKTRGWFGIIYW